MTKEEKKQQRIQKGIDKPFLPLITIPIVIIIVALIVLLGFSLETSGTHDPTMPGHATGIVGMLFFMIAAPIGLICIIISIIKVIINLKRRKEQREQLEAEKIKEQTDVSSQNQ